MSKNKTINTAKIAAAVTKKQQNAAKKPAPIPKESYREIWKALPISERIHLQSLNEEREERIREIYNEQQAQAEEAKA